MSGEPLFSAPAPGSATVGWEALDAAYPWIRRMASCPQDPGHHAEGDVWTHTRMACESLVQQPGYAALSEDERALLFAATALHDAGKPDCTRIEPRGQVTSRGHSRRGAILARTILWRLGVPFAAREQIAALIRHHAVPFYLLDGADPRRHAHKVSQTARCDLLALLADADARGRVCADPSRLVGSVARFSAYCREEACLDRPRQFPSEHSRFLYFREHGRDPEALAADDTTFEVVMLAGLPGAGKERWIRENAPDWPVVSLDAIRRELGVRPSETRGRVLAVAAERARAHLQARRPFVWSATNLNRHVRARWISLFSTYRARTHIVYLEVPEPALRRNIPPAAIERMLENWEVPDLTEAHKVTNLTGDAL